MKSFWKSLWVICALAGALTGATGCGPGQQYCPNTGNTQGACPIQGDDAQAPSGIDAAACPPGQKFEMLPDSGTRFGCVVVSGS
jgi:hypothetical protein